jgi:elongation factor P
MDIEDVHKNSKLLIDGILYNVDSAEFVKPGKGRAIYRLKLRNLYDGGVIDRTFHSGEKVEETQIATYEGQYLYKEGEQYVFMNTKTFEQYFINENQLGDKKYFLKEGTVVTIQMMNDKPLDVIMPITVELEVVGSDMTTRKETITGQGKPAVLETGYTINVPTFVKEGDVIKVDTRTGTYLERATKK